MTVEACKAAAESGCLHEAILPIDTAFADYPAVTVTAAQAVRFTNGGELAADRVSGLPSVTDTPVRVYDPEQNFLGLGKPDCEAVRVLRIFL